MTWRHLNFFQHQAYLNARVPRVRCEKCGVRKIAAPWARPDSGFTLLFEAMVMTMVSAMPVKAVARIVGEHDTKLWRVVHHYVDRARARADASDVTRVAIDETAARRGHDYISLFVDIDQARVLFAAEGRDASTVAAFAEDLTAHRGAPEAIEEVCIDMSPAFIKGVADNLPEAAITFDKFHAVKIINEAVDQVRRAEQKTKGLLRGTRYIWLRNPANLSERQKATLDSLPTHHLKTARAYQIRLAFQDLYAQPSTPTATAFLKKWYFWATHSRLEPMIEAAHTVKRHWDGILRWFHSRIANGLIEGINSLVQAAKAKARTALCRGPAVGNQIGLEEARSRIVPIGKRTNRYASWHRSRWRRVTPLPPAARRTLWRTRSIVAALTRSNCDRYSLRQSHVTISVLLPLRSEVQASLQVNCHPGCLGGHRSLDACKVEQLV